MNDLEARLALEQLMSSDEYWSPTPPSRAFQDRVEALAKQVGEANEKKRQAREAELERIAREDAARADR